MTEVMAHPPAGLAVSEKYPFLSDKWGVLRLSCVRVE